MPYALARYIELDPAQKDELGVVHTAAEIDQQPEVWRRTAKQLGPQQDAVRALLEDADQLVLTGAGSSHFVGKCAEAALRLRLGKTVQSIPSTEIVMDPEATLPRSPFVLVSCARSGNSPEGNAAFRLAEKLRPGLVRHVVVTCNPDGELADLARKTKRPSVLQILPPETNDQGLAMTSSFTSLVLACVGLGFAGDHPAFARVVDILAQAARSFLDRHSESIEKLAGLPFDRAFFVGSGAFYGVSLECHLKVQEMTDGIVVGKAEDVLGLRHGPMAAVTDRSLVILFASTDPYRRKYETDLLRELSEKNLGLRRVVVASEAEPSWMSGVDQVLDVGSQRDLLGMDTLLAPVYVLMGQLLGFFKSLDLGLKPDAPSRERVINRVVQGVRIYPWEPAETL